MGNLQNKIPKRMFSMKITSRFTDKNTMLVREFDRYILEYPEFANKIPDNALVVMQIAWK